MKPSEVRLARFAPLKYRHLTGAQNDIGGYEGWDLIASGATLALNVGFDTTSGMTHEPVRAHYAHGELSTIRQYFSCEVPAGAHRIEKVVVRGYAAVPSTDAQFKVGVWDHRATPVLYTSAVQSLAVSYSATDAACQYEWTPGAQPRAYALTPYDLKLDTGKTSLVGFVQMHNPCASTIYFHDPVVFFKCGAQYRQ